VEIYQIIQRFRETSPDVASSAFSEDFGHSWNPLEPAGVQIEVLGLQLQWQ